MSVHPGSIWLDNNWGAYPSGLWIAANATRMIAESPDYDDLIAYLRRQQIPLNELTVAYFVPGGFQ